MILNTLIRNTTRLIVNKNNKLYKNINKLYSTNEINTINDKINKKLVNKSTLVVHPINDPDTFGTLEKRTFIDKEKFENDEDDKIDEEVNNFRPICKRLSTKEYADIIKTFIKQHKIKEALDVLEIRMLKEDRVKPENYIYSLLIGACGRVGYTKKAFKLFNDLKKRGLKVHPGMYTGLFNACANSPWKEDGLNRAQKLLELIKEKQYQPNDTNYNAMIKAFGRHGDLETTFSLADEMINNKIPLNNSTINFLLQACVSNTENGFRYSLLVWHKMMIKNIKPDIFSFNLMLRCVRDCGVGNIDDLQKVLDIKLLRSDSNNIKQLEAPTENKSLEKSTTTLNIQENRPNLLAKQPQLGNIIGLNEIKNANDRLILLGGVNGVLDEMKLYEIEPDIKTFTQLLDCISPTTTAELHLLKIMKMYRIKPDIDFFNMLIKKRSMRFDHEGAKTVISMIEAARLRPDLVTYGVLAIGCTNHDEAKGLISELKMAGYRLNSEILGAMLQQACYRNSFGYVMSLMEICLNEQIKPNNKLMEHLLKFRQKCLKMISEKKYEDVSDGSYFREGFRLFNKRYQTWKTQVTLDESENAHPWTQYREQTETDAINYKDPQIHFKPRHLSRFKVKTSNKVRY